MAILLCLTSVSAGIFAPQTGMTTMWEIINEPFAFSGLVQGVSSMSVSAASLADWFSLHWKDVLPYTGLILLGWFIVTKLGGSIISSVNDRLAEFENNQRELAKTMNEIMEGLKMTNPEFKARVEDRHRK